MNEKYPFVNPPLPYEYDGLEPYIDAETMRLHHNRHLQTYVDKLNDILSKYPQYQSLSLEQLLVSADSMPSEIRSSIRDNAGGVYNHIFYFMNLKNPGSKTPPVSPAVLSGHGFSRLWDISAEIYGCGAVRVRLRLCVARHQCAGRSPNHHDGKSGYDPDHVHVSASEY